MNPQYSVITFATNKLNYTQFALNLAQSVQLYNDIPVFIVSDLDFAIPVSFQNKIFIIPAQPEHVSLGIRIKLHIDEYVQTAHTLFVDSDCLCYGNLDTIFEACAKMDVTVAGNIVPAQTWCGEELAQIINEQYGFNNIIRFCGGLYYMKKTSRAKNIFNTAREIAETHFNYRVDKLKNAWMDDEVPLSIAMALNQQSPIADNGSFVTDLYTDFRPGKLNVLTGSRLLRNPPYNRPRHRPWYPVKYSPIILHFGGNNITSYPYISQSMLLRLYQKHIPILLSNILVALFIHLPYKSYHTLRWVLLKLKPGKKQ
jgi:hypothetical protein